MLTFFVSIAENPGMRDHAFYFTIEMRVRGEPSNNITISRIDFHYNSSHQIQGPLQGRMR